MKSNNAPSGSGAASTVPLEEHGRQVKQEARALADAVHAASGDLEHYVAEQVNRRPYGTLGLAAGIGYVLGGGLQSQLTKLAVGTATRLGLALAARELANRLSPDSVSRETKVPKKLRSKQQ